MRKVDRLTKAAYAVLISSLIIASSLIAVALRLLKNSNTETIEYKDEYYVLEQYKTESDKQQNELKDIVVVPDEWIDTSTIANKIVKLDVNFISQYPELPTGCEITSLATVLNYYGYNVSKTELSEKYLDKGNAPADWREVFVGEPTDPHSFGCYSSPIVMVANRYLNEYGYNHLAINMSGSDFLDVLKEVECGRPVIIWGTQGLAQGVRTIQWKVDGKSMRWIAPEHCMVLIGYDLDRMVAVVSDPQKRVVEYNIRKFKQSFETMCSQCVFIKTIDSEESGAVSDDETNQQ